MKQINFALVLAAVTGMIFFKLATRKTAGKDNSYTAADFDHVDELGVVTNTPITEAAYHQAASGFAPAIGANENQPDEEVLNLQ
jgi:hypothetical protein